MTYIQRWLSLFIRHCFSTSQRDLRSTFWATIVIIVSLATHQHLLVPSKHLDGQEQF